MRMRRAITCTVVGIGGCSALIGINELSKRHNMTFDPRAQFRVSPTDKTPYASVRAKHLERLKKDDFDVLIIGGGATGAGAALDAVSRGLKVALIEKSDFASGTSSKSTKLIHGGVRYLEKAVMNLDLGQYELVNDALHERATFFRIAPHLSSALPIMTPLYTLWEIPYYYFGLVTYDLIAGKSSLGRSYYLKPSEVVSQFPSLKNDGLKGCVVYYDGQMNDARMNVSLAVTAAAKGAAVANYIEAVKLIKTNSNSDERISGVRVRDTETNEEFTINAKVVINATGPYADSVIKMDNSALPNIITGSTGVHLILDSAPFRKSGQDSIPPSGILIPKTSDGRVLFVLPWEGGILVGTTDEPCAVRDEPTPTKSEVQFILDTVQQYFNVSPSDLHVKSAWSGLRPLANANTSNLYVSKTITADTESSGSTNPQPVKQDTAKISRDHMIIRSPTDLVTIVGGKWTTYRKMAEQVVDVAITILRERGFLPTADSTNSSTLVPRKCHTSEIPLIGAEQFTLDQSKKLSERYGDKVDSDVVEYLSHTYGDRAEDIIQLGIKNNLLKRLSPSYPFIEAEVVHATLYDFARHPEDILARRMRFAFLDSEESLRCVPRVAQLMATALNWRSWRTSSEEKRATAYINKMTGRSST